MPWNHSEKETWFRAQIVQRSYREEVLPKIDALKDGFEIFQYGSLGIDPAAYPLYLLKSKAFRSDRKSVLITGGVHGYETSGVHGALAFLEREAARFYFNFVCAPCISPWAYETINRWNPKAIDPNRSFVKNSAAEECQLFLAAIAPFEFFAHFDLHETTNTDNSVFRPALAARDGKDIPFSEIPDGFYTVGDAENPQGEFQRAIIEEVSKITHIAEPDHEGKIIGEPIQQRGVIHYVVKQYGLCAGATTAPFTTTTEVYPDSPRASPALCVDAQVAAIRGGLEFLQK